MRSKSVVFQADNPVEQSSYPHSQIRKDMNRFITLNLVALSLACLALHAGQPAPGRLSEHTFKVSDTQTISYLFYLPREFDSSKDTKWPVILFLHGRGESRGPLNIVAKWGPPRMAKRGDNLPYILIAPQCPASNRWTDDSQQNGVIKLLDHLSANFPVDRSRIYLTGLSMGGYGSWKMAADHPDRFAAVAPICGRGNPDDAAKLVNVPLWVFHGTEDTAVLYRHSAEMVEAIHRAGGKKARFTTLQHVGHNSWSAAYATPELYQWFNKHQLPEAE